MAHSYEGQPIHTIVRPDNYRQQHHGRRGRRNTLDVTASDDICRSTDSIDLLAKDFDFRYRLENPSEKKRLPTIFKYQGKAKEVFITGSFNNWQKLRMNRSEKDFIAIVELAEGRYEYKLLIDGVSTNDPNASLSKNGATGEQNNVIHVKKADFDAFDALDMDSEAVSKAAAALKRNSSTQLASEGAFSRDIPPKDMFESRFGPPILPPHLLQVILNKDSPLSCESTLLPEPNHVMLYHLYALSIKDGVMVLSATNRYKKKYVTSLLYKPLLTEVVKRSGLS